MKEVLKMDSNSIECQLEVYIKDDMKLGGKAWCEKNIDNIQINKGVIDNFFDYFYNLTKTRTEDFLSMFPSLVYENEIEEVSYEGIVYDNNMKAKIIDSKVIDLGLASLLNIFVSRFKNTSDISALDWRTLEMDADAFAATDNFRNLVLLYNKFEEKVDSKLNIQPIDLFYWWAFAIRSNFLLMQNIFNDNYYKQDMTHLPSVARWSLIIGSIDGIINKEVYLISYRDGDSKEKIMKTIIEGSRYAENYFNQDFFTEYNWIAEVIKDKDYKEYVTEIHMNWENIKSELRNFSRLPLYNS